MMEPGLKTRVAGITQVAYQSGVYAFLPVIWRSSAKVKLLDRVILLINQQVGGRGCL